MDERERRASLNEALFREVNERVEELNEELSTMSDRLVIVCECCDANCVEQISMPADQYEQMRADATQFAVVSGHEAVEIEDVVGRQEGYAVVRKREGTPARIAEETHRRR